MGEKLRAFDVWPIKRGHITMLVRWNPHGLHATLTDQLGGIARLIPCHVSSLFFTCGVLSFNNGDQVVGSPSVKKDPSLEPWLDHP